MQNQNNPWGDARAKLNVHPDIAEGNAFGRLEAEQERKAFESDPDFQEFKRREAIAAVPPKPAVKTVEARYKGMCKSCNFPIRVGDLLVKDAGLGAYIHETCPTNPEAPAARIQRIEQPSFSYLDPKSRTFKQPGMQLAVEEASNERLLTMLGVIYQNQTMEERASQYSKNQNGVGFTKFDAGFLTDVYERASRPTKLLSSKPIGLSDGQAFHVRRKLKYYWKQLCAVANQHPAAVFGPEQDDLNLQAAA
jgi:hypothetical protein